MNFHHFVNINKIFFSFYCSVFEIKLDTYIYRLRIGSCGTDKFHVEIFAQKDTLMPINLQRLLELQFQYFQAFKEGFGSQT